MSQAAKELGVSEELIRKDVGALILALEPLVAEQIVAALAPPVAPVPVMSDVERDAALALLRDPHLLDRILTDFEAAGVVGEQTNKLVGYLAGGRRSRHRTATARGPGCGVWGRRPAAGPGGSRADARCA